LKRTAGGSQCQDLDVVGIDLFPWHSRSTGHLNPDSAGARWLDENVLLPAASIAQGSAFGVLSQRSLGGVAVLAVGKAFATLLEQLHFEILDDADARTGPQRFRDWPRNSRGAPTNRSLKVYRSAQRQLVVLQTSAPGSNTLPGEAFDRIVREMLRTRT